MVGGVWRSVDFVAADDAYEGSGRDALVRVAQDEIDGVTAGGHLKVLSLAKVFWILALGGSISAGIFLERGASRGCVGCQTCDGLRGVEKLALSTGYVAQLLLVEPHSRSGGRSPTRAGSSWCGLRLAVCGNVGE